MAVVSVSMPDAFLDRLDEFIAEHDYSGRSEVVREGTRRLLREFVDEEVDRVTCVVVAGFDRCTDVDASLSEVRHDHDALLRTNVHSHARTGCLELFVAEGDPADVGEFVARLRAVDGVDEVEFTKMRGTAGATSADGAADRADGDVDLPS